MHSLRKGTQAKASLKPSISSVKPRPTLASVSGTRWVSSCVERLGMNNAGTMASSMQATPTQTDSERTAVSALANQLGFVHHHPEPRGDDPGPLADPLRHGHDVRALVEVVAHLIAHGHIGDAEHREPGEEDQRPEQEVAEVVRNAIGTLHLPHGHERDAEHHRANQHVLPAPAPLGARVVGDEAHDRVQHRVVGPGQEEQDAPHPGGEAHVLHQHDHEDAQRRREHLVGQHAQPEGDLVAERDLVAGGGGHGVFFLLNQRQ